MSGRPTNKNNYAAAWAEERRIWKNRPASNGEPDNLPDNYYKKLAEWAEKHRKAEAAKKGANEGAKKGGKRRTIKRRKTKARKARTSKRK
jgi:hypothetical protein